MVYLLTLYQLESIQQKKRVSWKLTWAFLKKDNIEIKKGLEQFVLTLLERSGPLRKKPLL